VGFQNRDAFFSTKWQQVEIEIDGTARSLKLIAGFWRHCPEIRSPLIREWLAARGSLNWPKGMPREMELTPLGGSKFRLEELSSNA
jgi:hypothetical protein